MEFSPQLVARFVRSRMSAKVSLGDIVRQSRKCSLKCRKDENETKRSFITTGKPDAVSAVLLAFVNFQ
jgi:hypothetical protein